MKLFPLLKYTSHSIYSNTSTYTKHKLPNNLFENTLGWVYIHIPILLIHSHLHLPKKLHHNTIETNPLHILFQWDQNYFPHSNILSTKYIPTPVHPLITTYQIIYLNTLWVWLYVHIPILLPHGHFPLSKKLCCNTIQTIPIHILLQWDQNYFIHSNILSTQYIF